MKKLVIIRHGQSLWNQENRFTGWADVPLTEKGLEEAKKAGKTLKENGFVFTKAYTSYLRRAIKTLWTVLEEMDLMYIPIETNWRLNEKHYGSLQGLNKAETAAKYGEDQVKLWRRAFDIASPALSDDDERNPKNDSKYKSVDAHLLPNTESLKDTIDRLVPYWQNVIAPDFKIHDQIIIAAHGNSLRGVLMHLKGYTEEEILQINIPTAVPYVFEMDDDLNIIKDYYLADQEELKKLMEEVASQGKAK